MSKSLKFISDVQICVYDSKTMNSAEISKMCRLLNYSIILNPHKV